MLHPHPTPLYVPAPTVLAVGCPSEVLAGASAVLGESGVSLELTNLIDLRTDSARFRPLVLLVDAELYEFDPEAFDMVAQDVGAKLAVAASAKEAEITVAKLLAALTRPSVDPPSQGPPSSQDDERTGKWEFSPESLGVAAAGRD